MAGCVIAPEHVHGTIVIVQGGVQLQQEMHPTAARRARGISRRSARGGEGIVVLPPDDGRRRRERRRTARVVVVVPRESTRVRRRRIVHRCGGGGEQQEDRLSVLVGVSVAGPHRFRCFDGCSIVLRSAMCFLLLVCPLSVNVLLCVVIVRALTSPQEPWRCRLAADGV